MLCKKLKETDESISKVAGHKVKIIEQSGAKISDILTKSDLFSGVDCCRQNCRSCMARF